MNLRDSFLRTLRDQLPRELARADGTVATSHDNGAVTITLTLAGAAKPLVVVTSRATLTARAEQLSIPGTGATTSDQAPLQSEPRRYRFGFSNATLAALPPEAIAKLRAIHPTALAFASLSRATTAWWFIDAYPDGERVGVHLLNWCEAFKVSPLSRHDTPADADALRGLKPWTLEDALQEAARTHALHSQPPPKKSQRITEARATKSTAKTPSERKKAGAAP